MIIDVYRPNTAGQFTLEAPVETVRVDAGVAIEQLVELLNGLRPRVTSPLCERLPTTGAHDRLHFVYPNGTQRTISVARDGYRSVTVEGFPGTWSPILPLYATIDMLLPPILREELGNPVAYPPGERPRYISKEEAVTIALSGIAGTLPAEHPPVFARLMTRDETGGFDPALGANNASPHPARKVWLVSIHDDVQTRGTLTTPPGTVHGHSMVIDAETGMVTDAGWGTAPLGKEHCPLCRG